jgi:hypothetical protein
MKNLARKLALGTAALAMTSMFAAATAQARDWDAHRGDGRVWHDNGWRDHWHWDHGRWVPYGYYPGPAYYYGGPVYYGPPAPPVITYAQPGLSVGLAVR